MRGGLRIGRTLGIGITVDWSWVIVFLLMTKNLTAAFHRWHPAWPFSGAAAVAIIATLLFFTCVLVHELAHAIVAQAFEMRVREIRLFLFGGVSDIDHEPPSPGAELAMAAAGPLTSLALAFVFLALTAMRLPTVPTVDPGNPLTALTELGPLTTLLLWLGPANLMVGLFNLLPAFPLDGGRLLRALLWQLTSDRRQATLAASIVGRTLGWCCTVTGVAMFLGVRVPLFGQGASGLWLAVMGWFMSAAAAASYRLASSMDPSGELEAVADEATRRAVVAPARKTCVDRGA